MNSLPNVLLHGECMVFPSVKPLTAKKIASNKTENGYLIVAESETVGNHHVVDAIDGVEFYEDERGVLFMENSVPTNIRCLHENRHDSIELAPGTYEFGIQQEYDPFTARKRNVRD